MNWRVWKKYVERLVGLYKGYTDDQGEKSVYYVVEMRFLGPAYLYAQ